MTELREFQSTTSRGFVLRVWRPGQSGGVDTVPVVQDGLTLLEVENLAAATIEDVREAAAEALARSLAIRTLDGRLSVELDVALVAPVIP